MNKIKERNNTVAKAWSQASLVRKVSIGLLKEFNCLTFPAMAAVVSVSSIAAFFSDETKQIQRGENALQSQRLESFMYDGTSRTVVAKVNASMKRRTYDVRVRI